MTVEFKAGPCAECGTKSEELWDGNLCDACHDAAQEQAKIKGEGK